MNFSQLSTNRRTYILVTVLLFMALSYLESLSRGEEPNSTVPKFVEEPEARAVYDNMMTAMREAKSLSYVSRFERKSIGKAKTTCTYRVWLKKPNYFRMETQTVSGEQGGVLIGDGSVLWIYWPNGRPKWENVQESEEDEKTRFSSYMTKPTPMGRHSILHEAVFLGGGISFPILDASAFHGFVDVLHDHIDGVRIIGTEAIAGEACDGIEVSFLDGQRSWYLWVSKLDHLPRKLKEIVRVSNDNIAHEEWSLVTINGDIQDTMFSWSPPTDWQQWTLPNEEEGLPKPGSRAPAFKLTSVDGKQIKLSDYEGKSVWLCFWRLGCPPCREETPFLQKLYAKYEDEGFVVLGVNVLDDRQITLDYLRNQGVTFPNVLDNSEIAQKVYSEEYNVGTIPMNCLVNDEGIVVDSWIGHSEERAYTALRNIGLEPGELVP